MDNEYKVGALCELIAFNGNKNKTKKDKKKKDNIERQFQTESNLNDLPKNENAEKSKKRKSKNSNEQSIKKIKKNDKNLLDSSSQIETVDIKSEMINKKMKKSKKTNQINEDPNSEAISPTTFERKIKKKKNKILKNGSTKPNDKTKNIDKNSLVSPQIEAVDLKPKLLVSTNKANQINEKTHLEVNESKTFEKKIKKKKDKKSKDNSTKPNDKTKKIDKKLSMTKSSDGDIKSSEDYIEKESRTVFVGNVPVNVKMSAIKNLFKKFGEVETTRLRSVAVKNLDVPKRVSIMKGDFHPQRDTANVYVRFKTIEQAQKALVLNATQFEGHTIRVDMALNTNHKQNMKKGIFIGNLPYNIQEDEIWDYFKDCGTISAVRIVRDNATGVSKGFGYVDFENKESVELAMQIQGKKVQNREIRVKRIETKKNTNKVFNKKPLPFKRTKPISKSSQNFQGEIMKPKTLKKKQKPTKTDLMRKKIAKKLNA
ncbi:RNA-binding protein 34 [Melanaphis sacchari]|uniref:RNA-binding protein 34 n=1 Tax=Melanaphis sacchari TaxID=742174 RepID=UPI000DC14DDD|nr:RNA-binding protein 34 [Melanaphis sacchari]